MINVGLFVPSGSDTSLKLPPLWCEKDGKGKGEVPVHTMKTYRGSRRIIPLFLNLGTRWR